MKDWIKKALTKHIRQRTKTIEIPPDPRLVYGVKFTIALNEVSAQSIPTIVNGITTSTNIIMAFSVALSGILIGYFFKNNNRERDFVLIVLSDFSFPMIFQFFSYYSIALGQGFFEIAFKWALVAFLYSLLFLIIIFIFALYRMHERARKPKEKGKK